VPGDPQGEPVVSGNRADVLEALRRKMSEILHRPLERPEPADPTRTELPFVREQTDLGAVYRLERCLAPSHHIGRLPVEAAASARAEMLALLALDPSLKSTDPTRALFLDTETTGLGGGAGIIAFLVGLGWFEASGRMIVEQLLVRSPADEGAMLELLSSRVEKASLLVTYNGKTFDLPLLETRYVMQRRHLPQWPAHLDLLHVARRLHRARLGGCRLVHLEADVLGFVRGPDIDGADIAACYGHFLRTGEEMALRSVVEHNALDVLSMAALVGLYGEPQEALHGDDLVGLARTLQRAGALDAAECAADAAVRRGAGTGALKVRGQIARARGDRARALVDLEKHIVEVDDPAVRLELAKLYEHFVKEPMRALELTLQGTGEADEAWSRRCARLEKKIDKSLKRVVSRQRSKQRRH
jgi:hypothetical protein